jgi:glycosyltransferase involved in cell wall biosynthesis
MRILFVKESQNFPRSSGHDVHGFHMMQELDRLGHSIGLLTSSQTSERAVEGVNLVFNRQFSDLPKPKSNEVLPGLQGRFVSYWGIAPERPHQIAELVESERFDAVVVVGLHVLPYLGSVRNTMRVWYAADEWLWHHWSQVRLFRPSSWQEIKVGAIKGLYERAFNRTTDRVWAVTSKDQSALGWVMGAKHVDVLPNGVDTDHYLPLSVEKTPRSIVFWGRLDFGPNLDAVRWFGENVWEKLRKKHPEAVWRVFGFCAQDAIRELQRRFEFELIVDLPDLRSEVQRSEIVVLPFVSGGGIKNKLLEAAAMGMPILASAKALNGISKSRGAVETASNANDWILKLEQMWADAQRLRSDGLTNRDWVNKEYTWHAAAKIAESGLIGFHRPAETAS